VRIGIRLDNVEKYHTPWTPSSDIWNFEVTLDVIKSREMEIDVYRRGRKSQEKVLCAILFQSLENFLDNQLLESLKLELEPQGFLYADIKFTNPSQHQGELHDQADAKWKGIRGPLNGHNDIPVGGQPPDGVSAVWGLATLRAYLVFSVIIN
jgi:hypothetical protein